MEGEMHMTVYLRQYGAQETAPQWIWEVLNTGKILTVQEILSAYFTLIVVERVRGIRFLVT